MIGVTLIFEKDPLRLDLLAEGPDGLDDLVVVDLDVLNSLDFQVMCGDSIQWNTGQPTVLTDDIVVVGIAPEALTHVLTQNHSLEPEKLDDLEKIRTFVNQHGKDHIWEFSTY